MSKTINRRRYWVRMDSYEEYFRGRKGSPATIYGYHPTRYEVQVNYWQYYRITGKSRND